MANHKSSIKRIRSNEAKRLRNKYQHKTTRNAIKKFCELTAKKEAVKTLPSIISMIDKLFLHKIFQRRVRYLYFHIYVLQQLFLIS